MTDTRDTPEAALAAALETVLPDQSTRVGGPYANATAPLISITFDRPAYAAAILATLDGWTLFSNEDRDAAFDEIVRLTATIDRLRTALALIASGNRTRMCRLGEGMADIARTALSQEVSDD